MGLAAEALVTAPKIKKTSSFLPPLMAAASPPAWLEATPCPGLRRVLGGCGTWEPLVPSGRRVRFLTTLERRLGVVSWISSWRQLVRTNKFGIRGLKSVRVKGRLVYFWGPPVSLQKRGIFQNKTLGTDFDIAAAKAREWNVKLDAHRGIAGPAPPALGQIMPKTVADLFQKFEASPRFQKYVLRTRQDYACFYRHIEIARIDNGTMFGHLKLCEVTKQIAYSIYESYVLVHGHDSANKAVSACQAAFSYGMLKFGEIPFNPFSQLHKLIPPPRRQRWTDEQLWHFIRKADEMGYSSVGLCALLCMDLVQRPGDILNMKWGAYEERENTWYIRQSKRGAVVRVPETERLRVALQSARKLAIQRSTGDISELFVCPTVTGKRWQRRNFTGAVRRIAKAAGLPDDLQIRDLRRTGATEAASAGATPLELMAIGGWANQASIRPYLVQTVEQAANVQKKRDAYRLHRSGTR
jgi:integrase